MKTNSLDILQKNIENSIGSGDNLLIVPPFAGLRRPSIGVHILQSCAAQKSHSVKILYANIWFAKLIGFNLYNEIAASPFSLLVGEHIFTHAAHELNTLSSFKESLGSLISMRDPSERVAQFRNVVPKLDLIASFTNPFSELVAKTIILGGFKTVGFTSTFQQTNSSIAIVKALKKQKTDVITIIGGGNCEGAMAEGMKSIQAPFDYYFSGECETKYPEFLECIQNNNVQLDIIQIGQPCYNLDGIPTVDYHDYYDQLTLAGFSYIFNDIALLMETSRGCWWGEKHRCKFCGVNFDLNYRQKSPSKVIAEMKALLPKHKNKIVQMVDNIMPYSYFKELLPKLANEFESLKRIFSKISGIEPD